MKEKILDAEYFDPYSTLSCGQTFRWFAEGGGWIVISGDRACFIEKKDHQVFLKFSEENEEYFLHYFDLDRSYSEIVRRACTHKASFLAKAVGEGRGIRILNQDPEEMIFTFLLSQNNNIPRIRSMVEKLCEALGRECFFEGKKYFSFPSAKGIAEKNADFFRKMGFGYRADYIVKTAKKMADTDSQDLHKLATSALREKLCTFSGIGPKVADCILLFGFHRTDVFPVDTWIEKVYRDEFGGQEKDRNKISAYFTSMFQEDSGYIQQYLFYAKREGKL